MRGLGPAYPEPSLHYLSGFARSLAFAPSLAGHYQVEVYDLKSWNRIAEYSGGTAALPFSADGKTLAVSGILGVILLDPYSGKEIGKDL